MYMYMYIAFITGCVPQSKNIVHVAVNEPLCIRLVMCFYSFSFELNLVHTCTCILSMLFHTQTASDPVSAKLD